MDFGLYPMGYDPYRRKRGFTYFSWEKTSKGSYEAVVEFEKIDCDEAMHYSWEQINYQGEIR